MSFYLRPRTPSVWIVVGDSLAELTERYQQLVGLTPLPPVGLGPPSMSMGLRGRRPHLGSAADDLRRDTKFCPWLDITWMAIASLPGLQTNGLTQRQTSRSCKPTVTRGPNLGSGRDPGYAVRESGEAANIWCSNEDGLTFTGFVWPGATYFPDYLTASRSGMVAATRAAIC